MVAKAYQVTVTFQITEHLSIDAATPDEALRQAIATMDAKHKEGRFVSADADNDAVQRSA